jgi:hypothetical protein
VVILIVVVVTKVSTHTTTAHFRYVHQCPLSLLEFVLST